VQSLGLQVVLAIAAGVWLALAGVLFGFPVENWLKLNAHGNGVKIAVLCLAAWLFLRMIQGQLAGPFRATGLAYRAQHWDNVHRALLLAGLLTGIFLHWPLVALAALHLVIAIVTLLGLLVDLRRLLPAFWPQLNLFDWRGGWSVVRPSLFFGLGNVNQFVLYEVPLLILNRTAGAAAVVAFATGRTIFSAARQLITPVQHAIFPEITCSYGAGDREKARRLFELSEAVAWIGGVTLICVLAVATPLILRVWLAGRTSLSVDTIVLLAATGLACLLKDNKNALQQATNCHERSMVLVSVVYGVMLAGWWWVAPRYGLNGVAAVWLVAETFLLCLLLLQNQALLGAQKQSHALWIYPLAVAGVGGVMLLLLGFGQPVDFAWQVLLIALTGIIAAPVSAWVFGWNLSSLFRQFTLHFLREES
jgi:O-antigen/teichoic acid export membrane protein